MKVKVNEATQAQLNWMVAKAEGIGLGPRGFVVYYHEGEPAPWQPTTNWAQGGPIMEREKIDVLALRTDEGGFRAYHTPTHEAKTHTYAEGPTPLIAAMRCYVASELGDEVAVPDELIYDKGDE